jgi:hypothetical protein
MGNQRSTEGLHISLEKKPTPSLPQTPIASLVEMMNRLMSPDSSARAPTFATPISNVAPGIGICAVKEAVHVLPTLWLTPKSDAHALYPKLAGEAQGRIQADAPTVMKVCSPIVHPRSPPNRASLHVQKLGSRKLLVMGPQMLNAVGFIPDPKSRNSETLNASKFITASYSMVTFLPFSGERHLESSMQV